MASSNEGVLLKEFDRFATELYDFLWTKHRFKSEELEKIFADKLILNIEKPVEKKKSNFDEVIGDAVLCSQYLLRDFCEYVFHRYEINILGANMFLQVYVFDLINYWTQFRGNVFLKIIDSAAIIAEAILFSESEFGVNFNLDRAPALLSFYLERFVRTDFLTAGGWDALKTKVFGSYHHVITTLKPYIYSLKFPYEKLHHQCHLIESMKESLVTFPLPIRMFCDKCRVHSGLSYRLYIHKDDRLFEKYEKALDDSTTDEEFALKIEDLKKEYLEAQLKIELNPDENIEAKYCFFYNTIGQDEPETESLEEAKSEKSKKKKKKRKKKISESEQSSVVS